jgi:uncharacterized protein (DUF2141 family)
MRANTVSILFLMFFFCPAVHCLCQSSIQITIDNIKEIKGSLRVALTTDAKDFPDHPLEGKVIPVEAAAMTVVFEGIKPGDYAISIFHDENNNAELDTNMIGLPKEGFAFGNNAMGAFGPPSFEKASVKVGNEPVKQVISLKHL